MTLNRVWIGSPNYSSRSGSGVRLVVVHTAEGARSFRDLGSFFSSSSVEASSHTGIDDERGTIGEYVQRSNKAWTQASYNSQCVATELCAAPIHSSYPCGANWTADEWNLHDGMLANVADWIREECDYYGLPITKLSASEAQGSARGVCGHVDLGAGGGGHWDPGPNFPWTRVMDMARGDADPGGGGTPTPPKEDDMVASALGANGTLHVFRADGKNIGWTYKMKHDTAWNGGEKGKQVAAFKPFATAEANIVGITAELGSGGALSLWVDCANGKTYWTQQPKGETSWNGGKAGVQVAGLTLFAA